MPRLTPLQQLRLRHRYDIYPYHLYAVSCSFGGYGLEATELESGEVQEMLRDLQRAATADLKNTDPKRAPILRLEELHLVVDDNEYVRLPSALEIRQQTCLDCSANTCQELDEYYMVTDALWLAHVPEGSHGGMICIGCFEQRLGRELTRADFADVPLNRDTGWSRSERLAARLNTPGELSPIR